MEAVRFQVQKKFPIASEAKSRTFYKNFRELSGTFKDWGIF